MESNVGMEGAMCMRMETTVRVIPERTICTEIAPAYVSTILTNGYGEVAPALSVTILTKVYSDGFIYHIARNASAADDEINIHGQKY